MVGAINMNTPKVCLVVIDGWGLSEGTTVGDAIKNAETPVMDELMKEHALIPLTVHGLAVGLPDGLMGNSEVGHLNIGAGRIVYQDIVRIDLLVSNGKLQDNEALKRAFAQNRVHFIGLLSDGGVHSHIDHLFALLKAARAAGVESFVHAITDGRDTAPTSATKYLAELETFIKREQYGKLATVMGRYYAMDRDKRWERTKVAFDALIAGQGISIDSVQELKKEIKKRYGREPPERDEFLQPMVLDKDGLIKDGDAIVFFNYRSDRMRQIASCFISNQPFEPIKALPKVVSVVCMTSYNAEFPFPVVSPPQSLDNVLAEWISKQGLRQFHTAETEKYAHVTFFFNGGREIVFADEERQMVPSPKVATYDLKPEMSVAEVADSLIEAMRMQEYALVMCNFAPPDMVGHTGKYEPTIRAVEATDRAIGRVWQACQDLGYTLMVTSDHGNAEKMIAPDGGEFTAHTCSAVPLICTAGVLLSKPSDREPALCDVAPTILELMKLPIPSEMTGQSLVQQLQPHAHQKT